MPSSYLRYRRGEIWWVNLDPTVGNETAKKRPCVILQNDVGNERSTTTIVAPLLKGSKTYPEQAVSIVLGFDVIFKPDIDPL